MNDPEFKRLLAALSDPDRDDGPDLPPDMQCDPGVWAIWSGGPIKSGHDLAAARANRAWQRLREAGLHPEHGEGLFPDVPTRPIEQAIPAGEWAGAL